MNNTTRIVQSMLFQSHKKPVLTAPVPHLKIVSLFPGQFILEGLKQHVCSLEHTFPNISERGDCLGMATARHLIACA